MKIRINTNVIEFLHPCFDSLSNWLLHYSEFDGDAQEFLTLTNITPHDKIWVLMKLSPIDLVEVFALGCAFNAAASGNDSITASACTFAAIAAAYAAEAGIAAKAVYPKHDDYANAGYAAAVDAAVDAAYVATYPNNNTEREYQLDMLAYLIDGWKEENYE